MVKDNKKESEDISIDDILNAVEKDILKTYGAETLIRGADIPDGTFIKTGSLRLDLNLGGGIKTGHPIMIYGNFSTGKTTIALHLASQAQKINRKVYYIDLEHALDKSLMQTIPELDLKNITVIRPHDAEEALNDIDKLLRVGQPLYIVVDSVSALVPKKELEGDMEDQEMGTQAKLLSKAMRKLTPFISKSQSTVVFINQIREKMVMFGNPETVSGGRALAYFSGAIIKCSVGGKADYILDEEGNRIGHYITMRSEKCKWTVPFRDARVPLIFGKGYDHIQELIELSQEFGQIEQKGPYYNIGDKKYQGKEKLRQAILEDKDLYKTLIDKINTYINASQKI